MQQIIVPPQALIDEQTFLKWSDYIVNKLFRRKGDLKYDFYKDDVEKIKIIDAISLYVNLIYHDNFTEVKFLDKNRKLACDPSEVIGMTCLIIRSYYKITVVQLGKLVNMHHSTVLYHIKKHKGRMTIPTYRKKHKQLLKLLSYERLIPETQDEEYYP